RCPASGRGGGPRAAGGRAAARGGAPPRGPLSGGRAVVAGGRPPPPLAHVTTFGGHPLSCAGGLAALEVLLRDRLADRADALGTHLRTQLSALVGRGGLVEVRGLGLLLGLEFADAASCARFAARAPEQRLILNGTRHRDTVVRLAPPLVLTDDEAAQAVARIATALG